MGLKRVFISFLLIVILPTFLLKAQKPTKIERARKLSYDTLFVFQKVPVLHKGMTLKSEVNIPDIRMDEEASLDYMQHIYSTSSMWKKHNEPLRNAIGVLLYHAVRPPFDSTAIYLTDYAYDSIRVPWRSFYIVDSIKIAIPFIEPDTAKADTISPRKYPEELFVSVKDRMRKIRLSPEHFPLTENDTVKVNDSVYVLMRDFIPAAIPRVNKDTSVLVICDTLKGVYLSDAKSPFRRMKYPFMTDSMKVAVKSLLNYLDDRDSSLVNIIGTGKSTTDIWLNSNTDNLRRFWLHDMNGDSVTVWIGSRSHDTITMEAEEGVVFKRQTLNDGYAKTKINTVSAKNEALRSVTLNKLNPNIWKYRGDISFLFSQSRFSKWASGGNDNVSSTVDMNGYLYYTNKVTQLSWSTACRVAAGMIWTDGVGLRKNLDVIDIASKINHKAFGKFDFSGQLQFKTQSFNGYRYSPDTAVVSKFFNPATIILGYGLDYKPTKTLSINVSPISYKGILVPDKHLDATLYGVDAGKRSKNEMGLYVTINSTDVLFKKITLTNKIQLFSNFLYKPQNIDMDWEMTVATPLSWYADLKFNTFLIYDDESTSPFQYKELFGLTLLFRF